MPSLSPAQAQDVAKRIQVLVDGGTSDAALELARITILSATGEAKAIVLRAESLVLASMGRTVDSLRSAAAALEDFRRCGSRSGELDGLLSVGQVLRTGGDQASAIEVLEEADTIARELGDPVRIGVVLRQIGICCSLIGRHQQALSSLTEAVALHEADPGQREHISTQLSLYNAHNRHATSFPVGSQERIESLTAHLPRWRKLADDAAAVGLTRSELMAHGNHAITLHDVGRHREAFDELAALLPRYEANGMVPNVAICLFEMGRVREALGEHAAARPYYLDAVERFERSDITVDLRDALEGMANVDEALGDHASALKWLRRVRTIEAKLDEAAAHRNAAQREIRIELARLANQWHRLASTDPLTGLANRRALEQWFGDVQPRIAQGDPVLVLLHDLDHFKSINDTYGHPVGDDVLRRVARLIEANCRPRDLAVRYGGEEFVLAMVGIDHAEAVEVAERLRLSIQDDAWAEVAEGLVVTVSIGVAGAAETSDMTALLTLADRRLYAAKHGGRNRVIHDN